jgi:hypothetical protein
MTKFMIALSVFLAVCVGLALWRVDALTKQNTRLETEKKACLDEKEGYKNAQISSSKLIKTLRSERVKQASVVDCHSFALPEYVVRVLEQLK